MTSPGSENAVRVHTMKFPSPACVGGAVIVAIMALAVFVGGANACHHSSELAEKTSLELLPKADENTEVEA